MSFFLAIDAGGTKADYALVDETRVMARVRSGTLKRMRTDHASAEANLDGALNELTRLSGVPMQAITRTCIGAAGESVPLVADWLRTAFAKRVSGDLLILGDVEIALDAAFPGAGGVRVLAGTGANLAGRTPTGRLLTVGGWGPALADGGSGHRIGQQALRAIFLALDEQRPTSLLAAILDFWSLSSIDSLVAFANSVPPPDFSRLAEPVLAAALAGDPLASEVLREQGEELAHLVLIMIRRLQTLAPEPCWTPKIAFAGSIMANVLPVREALLAALRRPFPEVQTLPGIVDPIAGAIRRARLG